MTVHAARLNGGSGDALNVTLTNVDLASVDAILLRPPQFSGRLNATSTVSGPKAAPDVQAEYERLRGLGVGVYKEPYRPAEAADLWLATLEDPDGNYFQLASPMPAQ